MNSAVFWEGDVSWCFSHFCDGGLVFECNLVGLVFHGPWWFAIFARQQTSIIFRHGKLLWSFRQRLINVVQRQVCSRSLGFSQVKVLFHSFVANPLIFIMSVVESMGGRWVLSLWFIWNWCLNMVFILIWSGGFVDWFNCHKIRLLSVTHTNFVDLVVMPRFLLQILDRDLFLNFGYAWW